MQPGLLRRIALLISALLVAASGTWKASAADRFDYYVLALSWSPSWCADNDPGGRTPQCNGRRDYRFVVHGLWPQGERSWPENCATSEPDRVPDSLIRTYYDIIPSAGLAGHEWRKHGSCSGLTQDLYFRTLRAAYAKVRMPPTIFDGRIDRRLGTNDVETLMSRANPGLGRDAIAVACDNGQLSEIRICMTKSLEFRACPEVDRRGCRMGSIAIPSVP